MKRIPAIIFDIGGVVVLQPDLDAIIERHFDNQSIAKIKAIIADCFSKKSENMRFDEQGYFQNRWSGQLNWDDYQKVLTELFSGERLNTDLVGWIMRAKKTGYKIYALTNNTSAIKIILSEKFSIGDMFDKVYNSAEIGLSKPDPALFKHVLDDLRLPPESCVFVDDNRNNTETARNLGFVAIQYIDTPGFLSQLQALL